MGEATRRADHVRGAIDEVGNQIMVETATDVQKAFGPEFETAVAIFVRRKDDPENVKYFGSLDIPMLANMTGEMSRALATKKMLEN